MKSERIHIRIKPEEKAKLQEVADKKRRTITSLIEEMIESLSEEEAGNITKHDLIEKNLVQVYYNGDDTVDLQFEVKDKTVFVRNVPAHKDADEWYWDDKALTKIMAVIKPEQIDIR